MKPIIPFALLGAFFAVGAAAKAASTTPVGYYQYEGVAGGNIFIPGFVNPAAFSGALTASGSSTLTVAANSLVANAFNEGAVYATHYVEITSGPNAGVIVDIESNTSSVITLASDISGLSLVGNETITIRPHVTLKSSLQNAEASLSAFSDNATFYSADGSAQTYYYGGDGATGWSSDFATNDGGARPVPPGTGFVLGLVSDVDLTVAGEVKTSATVVQLAGNAPNIVGPVNPLVGQSQSLNSFGFGSLAAFTDSISVYVPGPLVTAITYYPLGDGTISDDFVTPTSNTLPNTTGAVVIPGADSPLVMQSGL